MDAQVTISVVLPVCPWAGPGPPAFSLFSLVWSGPRFLPCGIGSGRWSPIDGVCGGLSTYRKSGTSLGYSRSRRRYIAWKCGEGTGLQRRNKTSKSLEYSCRDATIASQLPALREAPCSRAGCPVPSPHCYFGAAGHGSGCETASWSGTTTQSLLDRNAVFRVPVNLFHLLNINKSLYR